MNALVERGTYDLLAVHGPQTAMAAIALENPRLIFAHAGPSPEDFTQDLHRLRNHPAALALPFVLLQNAEGLPRLPQALALGADKIFAPRDSPRHIAAYIDRLLRRHAQSFSLSQAWEITLGQICALAESADPFRKPPKIALILSEGKAAARWAARIKRLLKVKVLEIPAEDIALGHLPPEKPDLYLLLADQVQQPFHDLALLARLSNSPEAAGCGICLLQKPDEARIALAYDLGATEVLPLSVGDAELSASLYGQIRQSRNLQRIEAMLFAGLREALIDPLTGLHNRRSVMRRLEEYRERSIRQASPLTLLMIDLDHFKALNDQYGHDAGDYILSQIGSFISAKIPRAHLLARVGGEEFLCVLPDMPLQGARRIADGLCAALASAGFKLPSGHMVNLRMSIGIDSHIHRLGEERAIAAALARADHALLQAKRLGRARYHCSESPV